MNCLERKPRTSLPPSTWRRALLPAALLPLILAGVTAGIAREGEHLPDDPRGLYSLKTPSRDGSGKVYMGREISYMVGHGALRWMERDERERDERPDLVIRQIDVPSHAIIADIGAGSGYFSLRLSRLVPRGKVLAVDIQPEMLEEVKTRAAKQGITNVELVLGTIRDPGLPDATVDAVLMVDAYHEFSHPREMMEAVFQDLKPGGRVFLVEYKAEDPDVPMLPLHKMTLEQARRETEAVGLEFVGSREGIPWQHLMIFRRPLDGS